MENINWLSLVISALIPTAVGFFWYGKRLFMKPWMESVGMTEEKMKGGNMGMIFGLSIFMAFLLSFFLIGFNNQPGQEGEFDSFKHGAFHGAILCIFVIMPIIISGGLFEQRSWKGMFINIGYWLVTLMLMGGVIDAMNHLPNSL